MAEKWIAVKSSDGVMARVTEDAFNTLYKNIGYSQIEEQELVDFENGVAAVESSPEPAKVAPPVGRQLPLDKPQGS